MSPLLLTVLVVLDGTAISATPGGRPAATVAAGVTLEERGPARGGSIPVTVSGTVQLAGFVRKDRTGCRATADVELTPLRSGPPATVRRGAMLRPRAVRGDLLEVETVGEIVLRGTIPARACVSPGTARADETPAEGDLVLLARDAELRDGPDGAVVLRVPSGTRFNARERRQGWVGGRTDGAVVVAGWLRAQDLGGAPVGSPIDVLGRPLDHTHEILAPADVFASRTARRPTPVRLGGGAPIDLVETGEGRVQVKTVGFLVAQGWVDATLVREVTTNEESITLPPGTVRHPPPRRGPRLLVP